MRDITVIGFTTAPIDYDYSTATQIEKFRCDPYDMDRIQEWRKVSLKGPQSLIDYQIQRYFSGLGGWTEDDPRNTRAQTMARKREWAREADVFADAMNICENIEMLKRLIGEGADGERHPSGLVLCREEQIKRIKQRISDLEAAVTKRSAQVLFEQHKPETKYMIDLSRSQNINPLASGMSYLEIDESFHEGGTRTRPHAYFFTLTKLPVGLSYNEMVEVDGTKMTVEEWVAFRERGYWPYLGEPLPQCVMDALVHGSVTSKTKQPLHWHDCARIRGEEGEFWCQVSDVNTNIYRRHEPVFLQLVDNKLVKVKRRTKLYNKLLGAQYDPSLDLVDLGALLWQGHETKPTALLGNEPYMTLSAWREGIQNKT